MNKWVKLNLFFSVISSEINTFFPTIPQFIYIPSQNPYLLQLSLHRLLKNGSHVGIFWGVETNGTQRVPDLVNMVDVPTVHNVSHAIFPPCTFVGPYDRGFTSSLSQVYFHESPHPVGQIDCRSIPLLLFYHFASSQSTIFSSHPRKLKPQPFSRFLITLVASEPKHWLQFTLKFTVAVLNQSGKPKSHS